jgi:hypothetical protein
MSLFGSMIDGVVLTKAKAAIKAADDARRERIKASLLEILGTPLPDRDIETLLVASRQADAVRGVAAVAGKNMIGEILSKIADALEGR